MKTVSLSEAPKVPFSLDGRILHSSSSIEVIHLCLQPGEAVPQHSNTSDVIICLIKGALTLNVGQNNTRMALYDTAEIEKNVERGFINYGKEETRLLILKKL